MKKIKIKNGTCKSHDYSLLDLTPLTDGMGESVISL
jgi:hypothetical protein